MTPTTTKVWLFFLLLGSLALPAGAHGRQRRVTVAIDIGHSPSKGGAVSARGRSEYTFNRSVALALERELNRGGDLSGVILNLDREIPLHERVAAATEHRADILVSIHHDSVQEQFLKPWTYAGKNLRYCDQFSGFSIFVSGKSGRAAENRALGMAIGNEMCRAGFHPTMHHAQDVPGERRTLLDPARGVYQNDALAVLKSDTLVAVLVECGVIVNREEEASLARPEVQQSIAKAIAAAVRCYRGNR